MPGFQWRHRSERLAAQSIFRCRSGKSCIASIRRLARSRPNRNARQVARVTIGVVRDSHGESGLARTGHEPGQIRRRLRASRACGNWWFESDFLQRGVCKLSVPRAPHAMAVPRPKRHRVAWSGPARKSRCEVRTGLTVDDGFELSFPRQRISVYRVNPLGCSRGTGRRSGRLGSARFWNNHAVTAGSIGCSALLFSRGP